MGIETGKELEEFEKRLLGNSVRELFFQMNRETDKRFSEMKEKFFKAQVNNQEELFIETLLADKNESYKFDDAFYPMVRDEYGVLDLEEEGIYFGLNSAKQVRQVFNLLSMKKRTANKMMCPCGCDMQLGRCKLHYKINLCRILADRKWFRKMRDELFN